MKILRIDREDVHLALAATLTGIVIGGAACLLKWLVAEITRLATWYFNADGSNLWLILLPVAGVLIVGWLVRDVIRLPLEGATASMRHLVSSGKGEMPVRLTWASLLTCSLTLGFGGSGGAESPIAYTGAAISSNLARWLRVKAEKLSLFVGLGAGAGIAAIFQSPIGGFFYILEVLRMRMGVRQTLMAGAMCLIAYLTAYALNGFTLIVPLDNSLAFKWGMLPWLLLLGLITGIYSTYYQLTGLYVKRRLHSVSRPVVRNVVSGLILGVMICLFPALYGEGYDVLFRVVHGGTESVAKVGALHLFHGHGLVIWSFAGILLLKGMAVFASNSGGGVVGTFTPTLFAGGLLGAMMTYLVPGIPVPVDVMVLCGMGAAMAGIIQAPLMALFIVVELTGMSQLFLPAAASVLVAFLTANLLRRYIPAAR